MSRRGNPRQGMAHIYFGFPQKKYHQNVPLRGIMLLNSPLPVKKDFRFTMKH